MYKQIKGTTEESFQKFNMCIYIRPTKKCKYKIYIRTPFV